MTSLPEWKEVIKEMDIERDGGREWRKKREERKKVERGEKDDSGREK